MRALAELHVLRVFCDGSGRFGNALGVFLGGAAVPESRRQGVAADLGFSETVFVENPGRGEIRIFTPGQELPFAGHPCVGTAWLLEHQAIEHDALRPPPGEIGIRREGELTHISARPEWCPPFELVELATPSEVDELDPSSIAGMAYCWAWSDREAGWIRARSFPGETTGIVEDEATGSAAILLAAALGRELTIHQGLGSVLRARPLAGGRAEVGGRTVLDEVRDYPL